jgi:uncharacterized membrane protein YeaQ/YmgE (transglycosylase-associated protein family)
MEMIWFIVIGVVAGWLAGRMMRGNGFGLLGDAVVGVIGAFIGGYLWPSDLPIGSVLVGRLVVAVIGAVVLLAVVRLFSGRRLGRRLWS